VVINEDLSMEKLFPRLAIGILIAGSSAVAPAKAFTVTNDFNVIVLPGQFEDNNFSNDVWVSPLVHTNPNPISLGVGDVYQANFTLDKPIKLVDGFFKGNESFKFFLQGGPAGGGIKEFDYEFLFTGVNGGPLLLNPIKGSITTALLNPDVSVNRSIDLINGGQVIFKGIHLKLTGTQGTYTFNKISVGVDADEVSAVPGPLPIFGLGAAFAYSRKLRNRLKSSSLRATL
jgi:hypothetical protein